MIELQLGYLSAPKLLTTATRSSIFKEPASEIGDAGNATHRCGSSVPLPAFALAAICGAVIKNRQTRANDGCPVGGRNMERRISMSY
jgi:hypothetical protein